MRRVLVVSPHFPPDSSAASHRMRLVGPYLQSHGWEPTIVTLEPEAYEGRLDPELFRMVAPEVRIVRAKAWSSRTRWLGFGDLGLRAYSGLKRECARLLEAELFDAFLVTIFPSYPALLGRWVKRRHGIPFVLDYQDPWVSAWGKSTGPGGVPNLRSRLSRWLATRLEPLAVHSANALCGVSSGTVDQVLDRYPELSGLPTDAIPLGGDAADFRHLERSPRDNPYFDPEDGNFHLCYVGTLLPLGYETLRSVLKAVSLTRERRPDVGKRLRLHFFGTSNQSNPGARLSVKPIAEEYGIAELVTERASRIDYLDALMVQSSASALLLMGSSEPHYTASKLYPALLSRKPLLACYHEASTVVSIATRAVRPPTLRMITYSDTERAESRSEHIAEAMAELTSSPEFRAQDVDLNGLEQFSAAKMAERFARLLDRAVDRVPGDGPHPSRAS